MRLRILCVAAFLVAGVSLALFFKARSRSARRLTATPIQKKLVDAARDELTWGTHYDASYVQLDYPNGDVPKTQGACTDVIVRAYRAIGVDFQKLVHEDKVAAPAAYPTYDPPLDANI